jgi:UDP-N-acetylmuramoyl-tripeptide--D-alanyl-D-alanine ligase
VIPDEPATLVARARTLTSNVHVVGFGSDIATSLRGDDVTLDGEGRPHFRWAGRQVTLRVPGRHNVRNALLALALGDAWGVAADAAVDALSRVESFSLRSEIRRIGGLTVLADCYNANPGSVLAAAELLAGMPRRGGRVAVLGSMLELGPSSDRIHEETAQQVARHDLDLIVATGAFANAFAPLAAQLGDRLIRVTDPIIAFDAFAPRLRGTEMVLLKGSRGVALERLLPRFVERWGVLHPHGETSGSRASIGDRAIGSSAEHPPTTTGQGEA